MEIQKENNTEYYLIKSVWIKDKYNFYDYLSVMLDSWIPLSEALESVWARTKNKYFKTQIKNLLIFISSWDSFSKSMKKLPRIFNSAEISIVETWESTWSLVSSFARISENLKTKDDLTNKIKGALTYPVIILVFLFIAIMVVLVYVIPNIIPLFETSGTQLPIATLALIGTSTFVKTNILKIIFLFIVLGISLILYKNTKSGKAHLEAILLSLPLVWEMYKNYLLAIIAQSLWSLIWAWVNIVKTLLLVWKTTNNSIYEWLFIQINKHVSSWKWIVESMQLVDKEYNYFSPDFIQMLSAWEKTASIEEISNKINKQYIKEVDYSLSILTKWIEPIAILIAWIFVLWFAFAIFWAILEITQTVS